MFFGRLHKMRDASNAGFILSLKRFSVLLTCFFSYFIVSFVYCFCHSGIFLAKYIFAVGLLPLPFILMFSIKGMLNHLKYEIYVVAVCCFSAYLIRGVIFASDNIATRMEDRRAQITFNRIIANDPRFLNLSTAYNPKSNHLEVHGYVQNNQDFNALAKLAKAQTQFNYRIWLEWVHVEPVIDSGSQKGVILLHKRGHLLYYTVKHYEKICYDLKPWFMIVNENRVKQHLDIYQIITCII